MSTELNQENFRRIYRLNWVLCGPLLLLFGWPYYLLVVPGAGPQAALTGGFLFSLTFTLTVLHGHIAVALGSLHIDQYYAWQMSKKALSRLAFHPVLFTTRFRVIVFSISIVLLIGSLTLK